MLEPRMKTVGTKYCSRPKVPKRKGSKTEPEASERDVRIPGNIIKPIIIKSKNNIGNIAEPMPAGWALPLGPASTMIRWLQTY